MTSPSKPALYLLPWAGLANRMRGIDSSLSLCIAKFSQPWEVRWMVTETAALSDLEIAALYLSQLKRDATPLTAIAPTNTIEYLIGAGMRLDLSQGQEQ